MPKCLISAQGIPAGVFPDSHTFGVAERLPLFVSLTIANGAQFPAEQLDEPGSVYDETSGTIAGRPQKWELDFDSLPNAVRQLFALEQTVEVGADVSWAEFRLALSDEFGNPPPITPSGTARPTSGASWASILEQPSFAARRAAQLAAARARGLGGG